MEDDGWRVNDASHPTCWFFLIVVVVVVVVVFFFHSERCCKVRENRLVAGAATPIHHADADAR